MPPTTRTALLHTLLLAPALALLAACQSPKSTGPAPQSTTELTSVAPGINDSYLDPNLDIEAMIARFEVESREIYTSRAAIGLWTNLCDGMRVADIGAGTGLFTFDFAARVGDEGHVYAVEIAPKFVEHLTAEAKARNLPQVEVILATDRDVRLPKHSIQTAFLCDTYHHFEYPAQTLASIHNAIVPHGELLVIDFERIEGVSRPWILSHVRAGRETVIQEIEAAGFQLLDQNPIPGLEENYALRFRRL